MDNVVDEYNEYSFILMPTDFWFLLLQYLSLLELYHLSQVCSKTFVVTKEKRYKKYIEISNKILHNEIWCNVLTTNLNSLLFEIFGQVKIKIFYFLLILCYTINCMKDELSVFSIFSHLLLFKMF